MSGDHADRHYVIVGGTAGMGFAAARVLAESGATVALIGRDHARAADKADALAKDLGGVTVLSDGTGNGGVGAAIERMAKALGGIDGIAITAGPIHSRGGLTELTDADWEEIFQTQLMTTVRAIRAAIPLLKAKGGGAIVTTSAYSIHAQKQSLPHYTAMKAAVASLTKNIAKHHAADGIRANCIAPGAIASEALDTAKIASAERYPDLSPQTALYRLMAQDWGMKVAQERIGEPHEVGELIAFLLSTRATYMTGALLNIDGGTDF